MYIYDDSMPLYDFDELAPEAQVKAIHDYLEDCYWDLYVEFLKETIQDSPLSNTWAEPSPLGVENFMNALRKEAEYRTQAHFNNPDTYEGWIFDQSGNDIARLDLDLSKIKEA